MSRSPLSLFQVLNRALAQRFVCPVVSKLQGMPYRVAEGQGGGCGQGELSLAQRVFAAGLLLSASWAASPRDSRVCMAPRSTARGPRRPNVSGSCVLASVRRQCGGLCPAPVSTLWWAYRRRPPAVAGQAH